MTLVLPHCGLHVKNTSLMREQVEKQKIKNLFCELLKYLQKQPSRGVLRKRCSENMQQIYRRTTMVRHGCFPKSLLHIFRAHLFPTPLSWLLLHLFNFSLGEEIFAEIISLTPVFKTGI